MIASFLITLREGLEAALIVTIVLAYLRQTDHRDQARRVWAGVAAAVAVSAAVGLVVAAGAARLSMRAQEFVEGAAGLLAVAVLTWMIFWMRRHAPSIRRHLHERADEALRSTSLLALPLLAFTAVGREGLETVLFLYAAFKSSTSPAQSGGGAVLGLLAAAALGYGLYKGSTRLNLRLFFQITGGLIIVVAAGLLASSIHEFNEAGYLLFLGDAVWDTSGVIGPTGIVGSVLRGFFGYDASPTMLQVLAYWCYLVPALFAFYGVPWLATRRRAEAVPSMK